MGQKKSRRDTGVLAILIDFICVITIVPLFVAAGFSARAAWRLYHPKRRPKRQAPSDVGLSAERVMVEGADGVQIACWFIPAAGATDFVVLGHGLGRDSGMLLPLAKMLHRAGYHVLTFDMRNHGDSADDGLLRGQSPRYRIDHHNVVRYVTTRPEFTTGSDDGKGASKVACLGFSMSAWTSLAVACWEPALVRGVICDSGPTLDIPGTLRRMFEATRARLPRAWRGPMMSRFTQAIFTRAAVFFLDPTPWPFNLADDSVRVLFVSGENDPVVRPEDITRFLTWFPKATNWVVPRASHMQSYAMAADEYAKRVLDLLSEAFGRTPAPSPGPDTDGNMSQAGVS